MGSQGCDYFMFKFFSFFGLFLLRTVEQPKFTSVMENFGKTWPSPFKIHVPKQKKSKKNEVYGGPFYLLCVLLIGYELLVLTRKTIPFNRTITRKTFHLWDKPQPKIQVIWGSRLKSPISWEKTTTII